MLNRKFIKIFCLVILSIIALIFVVRIVSYFRIVNSEAYELAKSHMRNHEDLIEKIGKVKEFSSFPSGGIGYRNGKKTAQIETDVVGSKLSGKVILLMEKKKNKEWEYIHLHFEEDD